MKPHKDRIINITEQELKCISDLTSNEDLAERTSLISIHNKEIINVLKVLSQFRGHIKDYDKIIDSGLNETGAQKKKQISFIIKQPNWDNLEMIYCGPNISTSNPLYKTPRLNYEKNSDYDVIDLRYTNCENILLTKYIPSIPLDDYKSMCRGFLVGQDSIEGGVYDNWWNYYKFGIREMVGADSERTLQGAILPPNSRYVNTIISICFKNNRQLLEIAGLASSIVLDFFIKIGGTGTIHVYPQKIESFPIGIDSKYFDYLSLRVLLLNCLTKKYSNLWNSEFKESFKKQDWSIKDDRLSSISNLPVEWNESAPLRNWFERRMALVEIDVISSMALGLSLKDLETIYSNQFGVLKKNEDDTWYDNKGNIVFTNNSGLVGIGVDRSVWERIREMKEGETYDHTIEKSELYRGQHVTYYAPFTRQDRIEDYRIAWAHFEKIFNNQES